MASRRTRRWIAVAAVSAAAALVAGWWWSGVGPQPSQGTLPTWTASFDEISDAYGPKLYSQEHEETLIRAFFQDRRNGFFLDVGASDFEHNSTTYYLEKHLGWRGIAVDALEEFREGYERNRKGTQFFALFVTNQPGAPTDFFRYERDTRISSGSLERLRGLPRVKDRYIETIKVPSVTLDQLLRAQGVEKVDFVSLDIEGFEPEALEGFDIERYRPALLCVEIQKYTRDRVLRYFASHRYEVLDPYTKVDPVNLYFRRSS
jgi:FkbM family methyltransferase